MLRALAHPQHELVLQLRHGRPLEAARDAQPRGLVDLAPPRVEEALDGRVQARVREREAAGHGPRHPHVARVRRLLRAEPLERGAGRAARVRDAEEPGDLVVRVPDGLVEARREDAEARGGGREQEEGVAARDEDGEEREFGDFGGRGGQEGRERVRLL